MIVLKPKRNDPGVKNSKHRKILFQVSAFDNMIIYLKSNLSAEQGGFLLGKSKPNDGIEISVFIPAFHTIAAKSSLQFTAQTWDEYDDQKKEKFPGLELVGWAHTHPGLGVFLSNKDKTVNMFFKYIAVVWDPLRKEIGFFYLKNSPEPLIPVQITGKPRVKIDFKNYEIEEIDEAIGVKQ